MYTVRIATGDKRGSALSDYNAGVLLCLVGQNGDAVLETISPLVDLEDASRNLAHICSVRMSSCHGAQRCFLTASFTATHSATWKEMI